MRYSVYSVGILATAAVALPTPRVAPKVGTALSPVQQDYNLSEKDFATNEHNIAALPEGQDENYPPGSSALGKRTMKQKHADLVKIPRPTASRATGLPRSTGHTIGIAVSPSGIDGTVSRRGDQSDGSHLQERDNTPPKHVNTQEKTPHIAPNIHLPTGHTTDVVVTPKIGGPKPSIKTKAPVPDEGAEISQRGLSDDSNLQERDDTLPKNVNTQDKTPHIAPNIHLPTGHTIGIVVNPKIGGPKPSIKKDNPVSNMGPAVVKSDDATKA